MITKTFPSGDATAVLLPKALVEQYHLENEVALVAVEDGVLIKSVQAFEVAPREEWATLFAQAQQEGLLPVAAEYDYVENEFDKNDWTWPGL